MEGWRVGAGGGLGGGGLNAQGAYQGLKWS